MAYNKKVWESDEIITKEALNNIENGIEAVEQNIPKKTSQLVNDSGFITEHLDLSNYAEKDELHEHNNKGILDGINLARVQAWDSAVSGGNVNLDNYITKETFEEFANNSIKHIFITKAEYEALSEEDKHKEDVLYLITDGKNTVIDSDDYITKETFEEFVNNSIEHIFITEAEYEALSEEDKSRDDVLYLITDGENITIDLDNYVTKEEFNALLDRLLVLENKLSQGEDTELTPPEITNIPCTNIALNKSNLTFTSIGATDTIVVTPTPSNTTDTVSWKSSNNDVATVTQFGLVTSRGAGTCTLTATCGYKSATCIVNVTESGSESGSVTVTAKQKSISIDTSGGPQTIDMNNYFTVTPSNTQYLKFWSIDTGDSAGDVGSISSTGILSVYSQIQRVSYVTLTCGGASATITVSAYMN